MVNETNEKCFTLWGVCVFMFIDPFKIELLDFCEEFLQIASLNSHLLINITAGCFFFCFVFVVVVAPWTRNPCDVSQVPHFRQQTSVHYPV